MKFTNYIIASTAILLVAFTNLNAQEHVVSSGADVETSNGSVSYTLGQTFTSSLSNEYGTVTEGVQQPYEIFIVTGIDNESIKLEITTYPNPTINKLTLKLEDINSDLVYRLYDMKGALIQSNKVLQKTTQIDFSNLKSSNYILSIIELKSKSELKTFKIIKN